MNDKDLQAFDKWWEDFVKKDLGPNCKAIPDHKMEKAWQAACEYKKEEYLNIMDAMTQTSQNNFKLQAENEKLKQKLSTVWKEAEEFYLDD